MNVLIIGSGGREHAITWKVSQSPLVKKIHVVPGNPGIKLEKKVYIGHLENNSINSFLKYAKENEIDLVIVGPEEPLVNGIVDLFQKENIPIFGPCKDAAMLEGSKVFCKEFLISNNIPTAEYKKFNDLDKAIDYIKSRNKKFVIKVDGLAAGKGVFIPESEDEAILIVSKLMDSDFHGISSKSIIIEDYLTGEEASFICLVSGDEIISLASSKDHKKLNNNDLGPNTGGMGAYSPTNLIDENLEKIVMDAIIRPTINGLKNKDIDYVGFLYAGLMIDEDKNPYVLEYNCRLGDPEAQSILMRMDVDFADMCLKAYEGNLYNYNIGWKDETAFTLVLTSGGYPKEYKKGLLIEDKGKDLDDIKIFHSGTKNENGTLKTNGGRVMCITALGNDLKNAKEKAYKRSNFISWEGIFKRDDIGDKEINNRFTFS